MAVLIALRRLQSGQHSASLRVDHHKGDGPRKTKKADMAQQKMSLAPKKVRKWMKEECESI